jgi:hypothetical protein
MRFRLITVALLQAVFATAAFAETSNATVCLSDEFKLGSVREIKVLRGSIFRNGGPITGDITGAWRIVDIQKSRPTAIVTTEDVKVTKTRRCGEVHVQMLLDGSRNRETSAKASDNEVWSIDGVLDYLPGHKPVIELGRLVDDVAIQAQLRTDVNDSQTQPNEPSPNGDADASQCAARATAVAAAVGGTVGRQTSSVVFIQHPASSEMSVSCGFLKPDIFVAWENRAKPSGATLRLIATSGSLLTGAPQSEIISSLEACVKEALKPDNGEIASYEYDGMRVDCQSFERDGGAGTATISRRFGSYPQLRAQ